MGEEDVIIEVMVNDREVIQFYSSSDQAKAFFEDQEYLLKSVKVAFKEGTLPFTAGIKDVDDINSVKFLSEVSCSPMVATRTQERKPDEAMEETEVYEEYDQVIEEAPMDTIPSSGLNEGLIIDVGLTSDGRLNICAFCDYRTFNVGHFKIHMRQHTGESPFQCNFCDYKSKQKSNLKRHMKQHIEGKDHFECKMCNFSCSQEKVYKRHMILHSRSRPLRPCPFCDYFSTSLAHLTVHIRQHTGETPYHCGLCSYKTVQKSNLTRHLKKHRVGGRVSKADKLRCCTFCSYRTPNPAHLMAHIRAAHTGETPFACSHCNYKSAQRSNLKRHLRKHTGERPFKCHLCSYSTAYPYVLKKHIENHPLRNERFTCEECAFACYSHVEYKRHLKLHKGKSIHCCHICGYMTLNSDYLKNHLRKHTHERPYKCTFCPYDCSLKSNLKRHMIFKHSGKAGKIDDTSSKSGEDETLLKIKTEIDDDETNRYGSTTDDDNYAVEAPETYLEASEQSFDPESGRYINESENHTEEYVVPDEIVTASESSFENRSIHANDIESDRHVAENVEIVCEEQVITTSVEHENYEIFEDFSEETVTTTGYHGEVTKKQKNLSFLNKYQREELIEFKRSLQRGTQNSGVVLSNVNRTEEEDSSRHNSVGTQISSAVPQKLNKIEEEDRIRNSNSVGMDPRNKNYSVGDPEKRFHNAESSSTGDRGRSILKTENRITGEPQNSPQEIESIAEELLSLRRSVPRIASISKRIDSHSNSDGPGNSFQETVCIIKGEREKAPEKIQPQPAVPAVEIEKRAYVVTPKPRAVPKPNIPVETIDKTMEHYKNLTQNQENSPVLIVDRSGTVEVAEENTEEYEEEVYECEDVDDDEQRCELCGFEAITVEELKCHIGTHTGETLTTTYHCDECDFRTQRRADIGRHKTIFHGAAPPKKLAFICAVCDFKTDNKYEFEEHTDNHKTRLFKCKICELKLNSMVEFQKHSMKHIGEEPFECYYCAYLTARKSHLRIHMRRHAIGSDGKGPPYECYTCGFETDDRSLFLQHTGSHKSNQQAAPYKCLGCRYVTLNEDEFNAHMFNHSKKNGRITSDKNTTDTTSEDTRDSLKEQSQSDISSRRVPLKEWKPNVPISFGDSEKRWQQKKDLVRDEILNTRLKEEDFEPKRRGKRGWKALLDDPKKPYIDTHLSKKFHFDVHNLSTSKQDSSKYVIDITGEVLKSHGSLKKFNNYGEVIKKYEDELAFVMTNYENERQLRLIYETLKQKVRSLNDSKFQFTIYFRELDENPHPNKVRVMQKNGTPLSDLDISLSSDEDVSDTHSIDLDSDFEMMLETSQPKKPPASEKTQKPPNHVLKGIDKAKIIFDLNEMERVDDVVQDKIKERNERMKELRRLKVLSISPPSIKEEFINSKTEILVEPVLEKSTLSSR